MIEELPVANSTQSREALVYYMCDVHNKVNERLNKTVYSCKEAFNIWGGDCGCDAPEEK